MLHLLPFLAQIEVSSARLRRWLDTSCSSIAVGSCHTGGPFLFLTGAAEGGLGGTKGSRSSSPAAGSSLFSAGSFLDAGRTSGLSSSSPSACLVHGLDMLVFARTWQWLHMSLRVTRLLTRLGRWLQDSSIPTQYVQLWSAQLERSTDQKLDM